MKTLSIVTLLLFTIAVTAQTKKVQVDNFYENVEATKSGNYKDVLASLLQLSAKNIVGEDKSIDFNSTLFALKQKANPDLVRDIDYAKETFSRNFQLNFKAKFSDNYEYKGFSGGITYALVNERDKATAQFSTDFADKYDDVQTNINTYHQQELLKIVNDKTLNGDEINSKLGQLQNAVNALLNNENKASLDTETQAYYDAISQKKYSNAKNIVDTTGIPVATLNGAMAALNGTVDKYYEDLATKPLVTLGIDGTANEDGKFNEASASAIYLQGLKKYGSEFDIRAKFSYADTLAISQPRTGLKVSAGVNFIIGRKTSENGYTTKIEKSFFEVKGYFEYIGIYKNLLPDEDRDSFLANADVRIRIAEDIWIPLTIKYDVEHGNFLGFLNITYNINKI